jgi:predicted amidophosphoribosyltransferase
MFVGLRDLLWPRVCPVCERECEPDESVHGECLRRIARSRFPDISPVPVFSCWEDGPEWFRILHQWKYGGESALAETVAREMARCGPPGLSGAVLVPMPDDPARRLERGFSPVGDLTAALAKQTGGGLDPSLLRRRRSRASQTSFSDDNARCRNVTGIFRTGELARWPRATRLVLVDDQVTSGATISAAVSRLRARENPVWVWCAARAARAPQGLS